MDTAGAALTEIQCRLGHTSVATTAISMPALQRAAHALARDLVRMLGVEG